jgi:hypothetical protein
MKSDSWTKHLAHLRLSTESLFCFAISRAGIKAALPDGDMMNCLKTVGIPRHLGLSLATTFGQLQDNFVWFWTKAWGLEIRYVLAVLTAGGHVQQPNLDCVACAQTAQIK